ncbi:hypothetical protein Pse7367_0692 [Thalassoporum mexicanum PCC 7367]|uniref:hypothetical protein n=1 Tax=Thalassoporum mexicanum TaxID=3457544 RepID=UPI00029FC20D|nr:hypothetical protein [Pseudanabaena sp. PCC 7367]AFY68994.1 hypothetical protein Pse7367_0692 [Pseudanabaena sp. PCC 7367]
MSELSSFLFARPSFAEGVARIIDLGNTLNQYNVSPTPEEADSIALESDWMVIGRDLNNAMSEYDYLEEQVDRELNDVLS